MLGALRARDPAADAELRRAGPRLRPGLRPRRSARGAGARAGAEQLVRLRRPERVSRDQEGVMSDPMPHPADVKRTGASPRRGARANGRATCARRKPPTIDAAVIARAGQARARARRAAVRPGHVPPAPLGRRRRRHRGQRQGRRARGLRVGAGRHVQGRLAGLDGRRDDRAHDRDGRARVGAGRRLPALRRRAPAGGRRSARRRTRRSSARRRARARCRSRSSAARARAARAYSPALGDLVMMAGPESRRCSSPGRRSSSA